MRSLATLLFFLSSFIIRSSRWLAFVQQKEYRIDRLWLFLQSEDGLKEILRIIPKKADFSRSGFKRPKLTLRSGIVFLTYVCLSLFVLIVSFKEITILSNELAIHIFFKIILYFLFLICYLFLLPFLVFLSVLPSAILVYVQTFITLYKARRHLLRKKPRIIGITGSYGKTSTKLLLTHILRTQHSVFMTPKSFNTRYSIASSVLNGYKSEDIAVIEYGAYKIGEIAAITQWMRPELAIVTGLTQQHLGLFGSIENIVTAKSELVAALKKGEKVICNAYDERTLEICKKGVEKNKAKIVAVNQKSGPVRLEGVSVNSEGKLKFTWKNTKIQTQLFGMHYQELISTVIAAARELGITDENISTALQTFVPNEKFIFSYQLSSNKVRVIDDGDTSNPKGFTAVIELADKISAQKKVLVTSGIVDLGSRSREIHLELARKSKKVFNYIFYVSDVGLESFQAVFEDKVLTEPETIARFLEELSKDDLLVVEGRMPPWIKLYLEE